MTANKFGGQWTVDKLSVLERYLGFFTKVLADKPSPARPFKLVYIDAFAGTGRCDVRSGDGGAVIPGSASIALATQPPFTAFHFIEKKRKHHRELQAMVDSHALSARCAIHPGEAETELGQILDRYDWRSHRGVLFLDPYGLQCSWETLKRVQQTHALDVFFLLNVAALFRQAPIDAAAADDSKRAALSRVFGSDEWMSQWYEEESQTDLFRAPRTLREPGWEEIVRYATKRLRELFPAVTEPKLLGPASGPPFFALYFATSNPTPKAKALAGRVAHEILSKLH